MLPIFRTAAVLIFMGSTVFAQESYDDGFQAIVDGDYESAFQVFQPLADQGDAGGQLGLDVMYSKGYGVLKDSVEAVRWFRLAAKQGQAYAQLILGLMYDDGRGVLKDSVTAHMWCNISSANGNKGAGKARDNLEKQMTQDQIAEATQRAKVCMASNYADCD